MASIPDIDKSSRHQKIIGEFGEYLVCNWLSRSGFEVARVDHTGIDALARRPKKAELPLGITVKARTRDRKEREEASVNLFTATDREKLRAACAAFGCEEWIAVYVETTQLADLYLLSLDHYDSAYRATGRALDSWKMGKKHQETYSSDPEIKHVRIEFSATNWWPRRD